MSIPFPSEPGPQQSRILLYFLPACGCAVSFVYFISFLFFLGYYYGGMFNLVYSVVYLLTFIFYLLDRISIGKHYLAWVFVIQVCLHATYFFPQESYFQLYFLVAVPLVFMLFDAEQKIPRYFYSTLVLVLLGFIQLRSDTWVRPFNFTHEDIALTRNYNLFCSFLVLSISAFIYIRLMEKNQIDTQQLASTDVLTGLDNRRTFYSLGNHQLSLSKRDKTPLTLIFIDIDHFKQINDQYGHAAGDEALVKVADLIKTRCRESDLVARLGGDEFVMLLSRTDINSARVLAEEIIQSIGIGYRAEFNRNLSISIGLAAAVNEDQNIDSTLQRADKALYQAKSEGRNRLAISPV
ncbi:MAG: GGDEF domain-containing protein [Pseudomonadota bacterium]